MTKAPTIDLPGFVAEKPEHCHECYRLIRPGQRYMLTMEQAVVCPSCASTTEAIRLSRDLRVEAREDGLLVRTVEFGRVYVTKSLPDGKPEKRKNCLRLHTRGTDGSASDIPSCADRFPRIGHSGFDTGSVHHRMVESANSSARSLGTVSSGGTTIVKIVSCRALFPLLFFARLRLYW